MCMCKCNFISSEKDWMQKTQQFFTQTFFPAYEHSLKLEEERLKLREKNRSGLADPDKAGYLKKNPLDSKKCFLKPIFL